MLCYIALLTKDGAERYRVQLPDFPGSATTSDTLDDACVLAERLLREEIALRSTSGQTIPRPTAPEWLLDRAQRMKAIPIVVTAPEPIADRVSVHLNLPAGLVERVDERARVRGVARADLLEKAARLALWETGRPDRRNGAGV